MSTTALGQNPGEILSSAPSEKKMQLRLRPRWDGVDRDILLVVCTWDPLAWQRPSRAAITVIDDGSFGAVLDIPLLTLRRTPDDPPGETLGKLAASAEALLDTATRAVQGEPGARADALATMLGGALHAPRTRPGGWSIEEGWTPMDAATVLRFVEHEHGDSGIDAVPRPLDPHPCDTGATCGACAGSPYEVPFELDLARPGFCSRHRAHALAEMSRICSLAEGTNEAAFAAYAHAMGDLIWRPHLPFDIRARVGVLVDDPPTSEAHLLEDAVLALARWADGEPERWIDGLLDLGAYNTDTGDSFDLDAAVFNAIYRAGARGDLEVAAGLVDAAAPYYGPLAAHLHGELAVQLAEQEQGDAAQARIETALALSTDPLTLIMAGDVACATGELDEGQRWYERARSRARALDDLDLEHEALFHLEEGAQHLEDEDAARRFARDRERVAEHLRARQQTDDHETFTHADHGDFGRKVSRNEPCPCGSGRKFKRCHG